MSIRDRSIMRWIRQKWSEIRGDRLTILNALSVPSTGLFLTSERLPYSTTLYTRPPQVEGYFRYEWRWLTPPIRGVSVSPLTSAYTVLSVEANAEIGVLARLECVGLCDGVEYRSDPYTVQVLPLSSDV